MYAPINNIKIQSREHALKMIETTKTTLTEKPIYSRPVLTKKVFMELNAITGRLGSRGVYRKRKINRQQLMDNLIKAYFTHDYKQ